MRPAVLYTLTAAVLWGTTFPSIRVGLDRGEAGPFSFVLYRFLLALLVLLVYSSATRRFDLALFRSPFLWFVGACNAAGYLLQFLAQDRTSASKTSLLVDINVVAVALLSVLLLRERHGRGVWIALALSVGGVFLLSTNGDFENARFTNKEFAGDMLALAAGIVWSFSYVGIKHHLDRHPKTDGVALTTTLFAEVVLFTLPIALAFEGARDIGNATAWAMILYLGLIPTSLAFLLWMAALRTETATATAVMLLLEIVVAVAIGVAFLGERMGGWAVLGALLITLAAYLASRAPPAPRPTEGVGLPA